MANAMGTTTIDWGEVEIKLRTYLRATGLQMSSYVRRAVSEHIEDELLKNPGIRARYDEAMTSVTVNAGGNVATLIVKRRPRKRAGAA